MKRVLQNVHYKDKKVENSDLDTLSKYIPKPNFRSINGWHS